MGRAANCERIRTSVRLRPLTEEEAGALPRGYNDVYCNDKKVYVVAKARGTMTPTLSSQATSKIKSRPAAKKPGGDLSPFGRFTNDANNNLLEHLSYGFEHVFGEEANSMNCYERSGTQDIVKSIYGGFNGTVFVYGQTGTGKTYTMDHFIEYAISDIFKLRDEMADVKEVGIFMSVVELYNEIIKDMIGDTNNLPLRMGSVNDGGASVVIDGLIEQEVRTREEFMAVFEEARKKRMVAGTAANARSSRSHLLVRIKVEVLDRVNTEGPMKTAMWSCLNMVDLAGSERVDKTGSSALKSRFKEATNINRDLLCLGNVITALVDRSEGKKAHVPYRTSKLTRILQDGLGGNGRTAVIVTMTRLPGWHMEQTKHTLEFASRANRVICAPRVNIAELPQDHAIELKWYQEEIERLRELLAKSQEEIKIIGQRSHNSSGLGEGDDYQENINSDSPAKVKTGKGVSFDKDSILKELEQQTAKLASVQAQAQSQLRAKFQRRAKSFAVRRHSSKLDTYSEDLGAHDDGESSPTNRMRYATRSGPAGPGGVSEDGFEFFAPAPAKLGAAAEEGVGSSNAAVHMLSKGGFPRRSASGQSTFSSMVASKKQEYTELSKQLEAVTHNLIAERRAKEDQESKLKTMEVKLRTIHDEKAGEIEELASKLRSVDAVREAKEAEMAAQARQLAAAQARVAELEGQADTYRGQAEAYKGRADALQSQLQAIGIDVKLVNDARIEVANLSSMNHVKETVMNNQQSLLMAMSKRIHEVSEQLSEVNAENELLRQQLQQAENHNVDISGGVSLTGTAANLESKALLSSIHSQVADEVLRSSVSPFLVKPTAQSQNMSPKPLGKKPLQGIQDELGATLDSESLPGALRPSGIPAGALSGPLPTEGDLGEDGITKMYENDAALTSQSTAMASECVSQLVAFQAAMSSLHASMLGEVSRMQRLSDAVRQVRAASPEISTAAGAPLAYAYSVIDSCKAPGGQLDAAVEGVETSSATLRKSLQHLVNGLILIPNVEMPVMEEDEIEDLDFHLPGPPSSRGQVDRDEADDPATKILNDRLDRLKGVAMALRTKLGVKQAELAMAHGSDQKLRAKVKALEAAVVQYNSRMEELEETLDILQRENADLYNVLNELDEENLTKGAVTATGTTAEISTSGTDRGEKEDAAKPALSSAPGTTSNPVELPDLPELAESTSPKLPSAATASERLKKRGTLSLGAGMSTGAHGFQSTLRGYPSVPNAVPNADTLREEVLQLWEGLFVPLWHRTDFFSNLWENAAYVAAEHARLKWMEDRMKRDVPTRDRVRAHLSEELSAVCAAVHHMPKSSRSPIYTEWGIDLKSKRRKTVLAAQLWKADAPAQRSASTHSKILAAGRGVKELKLLKVPNKLALEATYAALSPVVNKGALLGPGGPTAVRASSGTWRQGGSERMSMTLRGDPAALLSATMSRDAAIASGAHGAMTPGGTSERNRPTAHHAHTNSTPSGIPRGPPRSSPKDAEAGASAGAFRSAPGSLPSSKHAIMTS